MSEVALVGGLNALAFWRNRDADGLFLLFLCVPVDETFGFYWASTGTVGDRLWIQGICVVVLGGYMLYRAMLQCWPNMWRWGKR